MGVRVRLTKNSSAYFPFWLAIPVVLIWYTIVLVALLLYAIFWVLPHGIYLLATGRAQA